MTGFVFLLRLTPHRMLLSFTLRACALFELRVAWRVACWAKAAGAFAGGKYRLLAILASRDSAISLAAAAVRSAKRWTYRDGADNGRRTTSPRWAGKSFLAAGRHACPTPWANARARSCLFLSWAHSGCSMDTLGLSPAWQKQAVSMVFALRMAFVRGERPAMARERAVFTIDAWLNASFCAWK